jgi:hypothetical protein
VARGYTTRKIEVWSIHAHVGAKDVKPVDYRRLFQTIAELPPRTRVIAGEDKLVALPRVDVDGNLVRLTAYEGSRGLNPIIFNTTSAEERVERLEAGEILATKTHGIVNLVTRDVLIEYNHQGAKAADIADVLERAVSSSAAWPQVKVELTPVVAETFIQDVNRFERIRVANARVVRPNVGWSDWEDELTKAADDSNAQSVQVEFNAPRGQSLSKTGGVVPFIKRLARPLTPLKSAAITGRRPGEAAETTISTANHIEHQRINVRLDGDGHVDDADIERRLSAYEETRRPDEGE